MAVSEEMFSAPTRPSVLQIRSALGRLQELPGWFPTVQRVMTLAVDPRVDAFQLEVGLAVDPTVSARVLAFAGSRYFGLPEPAGDIRRAVGLLSHDRLRALLRLVLISGFLDSLAKDLPRAEDLRRLAVDAAAASYLLAAGANDEKALESLSVGLVHNVADFAMARLYPASYTAMEDDAATVPATALERTAFGVDFPTIGGWVMESWSFPRFFVSAVEHQRNPANPDLDAALRPRLARVALGIRLAECRWHNSGVESLMGEQDLMRAARLSAAGLAEVYAALPGEAETLQALLEARPSSSEPESEPDSPSPEG